MPLSATQIKNIFGNFSYRPGKTKGSVVISRTWQLLNLRTIKTRFGNLKVHKKVQWQMQEFLNQAIAAHLIHTIDGTFVPRHIMWNPRKGLSSHSWGIAIDIDAGYGRDGRGGKFNIGGNSYQPKELLALAKRYGFEYGGIWNNSDGMHFEVIRVLAPKSISPIKVPISNKVYSVNIPTEEKDAKAMIAQLLILIGFSFYKNIDGTVGTKATEYSLQKIIEAARKIKTPVKNPKVYYVEQTTKK